MRLLEGADLAAAEVDVERGDGFVARKPEVPDACTPCPHSKHPNAEQRSIVIGRPMGEVFAYVTDLRHSAEWQAGLLEVRKVTEGPLGVGTKFAFVRKVLGRTLAANNEFVTYEPDKLVTFRIYGPMPGEASYLFEPTPEGTKITSMVGFQPTGLSRLAEPLIAASLRRQMAADFAVLKDLLERAAAK